MNHILLFANFEELLGIPIYLGYLFFFVFGTIIGSFLNVVIHRIPNEESIVFPDSACPNCKSKIKAYDNIPILSWLILGGKCRNCKTPISPRYIGVEALTGALFALVFWHDGLSLSLPFDLVFAATILSLIFIDAENMILPDVINFPFMVLVAIARFAVPLLAGFTSSITLFKDLPFFIERFETLPLWANSLLGAATGALIGGGSLWFLGWLWRTFRGVEGMGGGDVKMMFWVGAFLGWQLTFLTLFIGAFSGAIIGLAYIYTQKDKDLQEQIPFGIFLGIGSLVSMLFGNSIIAWYFATFVPR